MSSAADIRTWHEVLAPGFAIRVVFPEIMAPESLPWTVFSRGPVAAAYPRFPVGIEADDEGVIHHWHDIRRSLRSTGVDLLRCSAPVGIASGLDVSRIEGALPETVIERLPDWRAATLPSSIQRKFRAAEKLGMRAEFVDANDGEVCHRLYLRAVSRQGGVARYPLAYFRKLCAASSSNGPVAVAKAVIGDSQIAGFVAILRLGITAYYLHGGYEDGMSAARPGYFLMRWAIDCARDFGAVRFNLLASPKAQPSLRAFKESFGGVTYERAYWQEPLGMLGRGAELALQVADRANRVMKRKSRRQH